MGRHLHPVRDELSADGQHAAGRPIRVGLAEAHEPMRRALRRLLDAEPDINVVAATADVSAVMGAVRAQQPQVLVVGLSMSDGSIFEMIRMLRERMPGTEIVIVTMDAGVSIAQHVLAAGAAAFVLKEQADRLLPEAVRRAARGQECEAS